MHEMISPGLQFAPTAKPHITHIRLTRFAFCPLQTTNTLRFRLPIFIGKRKYQRLNACLSIFAM